MRAPDVLSKSAVDGGAPPHTLTTFRDRAQVRAMHKSHARLHVRGRDCTMHVHVSHLRFDYTQ
ncbi:hypothetical protein GCM10022254_32820 [Actinomadura meridiana]|uniref:Uncharacterized protein n=1 Tax=Actinomadura meridiana TaxID=559626 RepID=A0ABP8C2W4_9ACTN